MARVVSEGVTYTVMATQQGLVMATTVSSDFSGSISGVLGDNDGDYVNDLNYGLRQPDGTYNTDVYSDDEVRQFVGFALRLLATPADLNYRPPVRQELARTHTELTSG